MEKIRSILFQSYINRRTIAIKTFNSFIFCAFICLSIFSRASICNAQEKYTLGAGAAGGVWYLLGGAIADIISKSGPDIRVDVEPGGAPINIQRINNPKDAQFGLSLTSTDYEAYRGEGEFKGKKQSEIRSMLTLLPFVFHVIAVDGAGINEIEDLKGKRYTPAFPGQSSYTVSLQVLEIHGLNLGDTKARPQGFAEAHDGLKDLHLDAFSWLLFVPQTTVLDVALKRQLKLVGFRKEKADEFVKKHPMYTQFIIPAKTYPFQEKDILTISTVTDLLVRKDISEDIVYRAIKNIYNNKKTLERVHVALSYLTPENSLKDLTIPLHLGAEKYYKEIGMKIPDRLLSK